MWVVRRYNPSKLNVLLSCILLTICIYITFRDRIVSATLPIKLPSLSIVSSRTKSLELLIKTTESRGDVSSTSTPSSNIYLHVKLNLAINTAICQGNEYLILYVLSTVTNFERRKVVRSTWGTKQNGVCFVFILGQPSSNVAETQLKVQNEKQEFKDIVQTEHTETYANVIYKEVAALLWAETFYSNISYLFKTDDDLIIDSILVSKIAYLLTTNHTNNDTYLQKYRPTMLTELQSASRTNFFRGGWSMDYQPTMRGNWKFGVSEKVWPHKVLPLYCSGFGWFMSKDTRDQLVNASYTYPLSKIAWIGDVFVSGFLAKAANVKCTGIAIDFAQTGSANCSCEMVKNPMLTVCSSTFHTGGSGTEVQRYQEYQKAWQVIQLRHNITNTAITVC